MARIVELTYPANVTLLPGATQNWRDLPEQPAPEAAVATVEADDAAPTTSAPAYPPAEESADTYFDPRTGDIPSPGATSALLHGLVGRLVGALPRGRRRILVVGPHDPRLLAGLAEVGDLTVVVRAIPDAAAVGTALPAATVLCGNLANARRHSGTYDLVLALDDVTRVHSLEDAPRAWRELADEVVACVADGGTLALGVENDLGLHRLLAARSEESRDLDANWSPLMTWDATRPRTGRQIAAFAAAVGETLVARRPAPAASTAPAAADSAPAAASDRTNATCYQLFPDWRTPHTAGIRLDEAARSLRDLLAALAGRPVADRPAAPGLLQRRAIAMADRWPEVCAGWVLVWGPGAPAEEAPAVLQARGDSRTLRWVAEPDGLVTATDGNGNGVTIAGPLTVPPQGRTLLLELTEAAIASDTPSLRRILAQWRDWSGTKADTAGWLPTAYAELRFSTLLAGAPIDNNPAALEPTPLEPTGLPARLAEARWRALGDLLATWHAAGIRTPWPSSMHPHTAFRALTAMAGVAAPDDVAPYCPDTEGAEERPMTGQEMAAVIERQREQLRGAWSRFHWDEKQYLTFRAENLTGRIVRKLRRETIGRIRPSDGTKA